MDKFKDCEALDFVFNINNKMQCFIFSSIRPVSKKYKIGERYRLRINDVFFSYGDVIDIKKMSITQILENNIHLTDAGLEEKEFMEYLEKLYAKRSWWNGKDSLMNVIYIKRVSQTNIFDFTS